MIAHRGLLVNPAKKAGMKVPDDIDNFDPNQFPHWDVFVKVQIGARMPSPSAHWDNAETITAIPDDRIKSVTFHDLIELGLSL